MRHRRQVILGTVSVQADCLVRRPTSFLSFLSTFGGTAFGLCLLLLPTRLIAQPVQTPALTNLAMVRALSPADASEARPVALRATVTYFDPEWPVTFLDDGTAGIYLDHDTSHQDPEFQLKAGQLIELEGTTIRGLVRPNLRLGRLRVVGAGIMPEPLNLRGEGADTDEAEARWVRVSGWLSASSKAGNRLYLDLAIYPGKRLKLFVSQGDPAAVEELRGSMLQVEGVFALETGADGKKTGRHVLWVGDLRDVRKLGPISTQTIAALSFSTGAPIEPARIEGELAGQQMPDMLLLRDPSGTVGVECRTPPPLRLGDRFEAIGYPLLRAGGGVLVDASVATPLTRDPGALVHFTTAAAANTNLPVLRKVAQVRNLAPREASRGYPVRVTGVVTHSDPATYLQFVQDDTAGIYLELRTIRCVRPWAAVRKSKCAGSAVRASSPLRSPWNRSRPSGAVRCHQPSP
ncbi:MAG: hypothetical protein U1G07_25165 [Verrucomicrobiota bacterium]